ncbi:MAG: MnhB domain-containing protein [Bacteroidales bacterium]
MNSEILKMAIPVLKPLFIIVSIWLLIRGLNYPGGGFMAGLIAGSSFVLEFLAFDKLVLTRKRRNQALIFITLGIVLVLFSALAGLFIKGHLLEGLWVNAYLPEIEFSLKLGTPLVFNIGIYFSILGFVYIVFTSMMEEWIWK